MSAAQSEETLPILLFYGYFTRIVFLDQLLFDFDAFAGIAVVYKTLCNSPGLQRVHISAKQIFHAPLHPSNKKFLSPRFWETRDQRPPESFPSGRRGRAWVRGWNLEPIVKLGKV